MVVTRRDERGRRTIYDALPPWAGDEGWVPAGRLDLDSRGLLLLVKPPSLVETLTRPGALLKTYHVWIRGRLDGPNLSAAISGVDTPLGPLSCRSVEVLGMQGPKTHLLVELDEGKNRHIRRLFGALRDPERGTPLKVLDLKRTAIGPIQLDVPSGAWRILTYDEVARLLQAAGKK